MNDQEILQDLLTVFPHKRFEALSLADKGQYIDYCIAHTTSINEKRKEERWEILLSWLRKKRTELQIAMIRKENK